MERKRIPERCVGRRRTAFSRVLLKEISDTGARTKDVFGGSIADLHETVVTSLLLDNQFHAALAIDIMDRNLYERANDCRWWALAPVFVDPLSRAARSEQDAQSIGAVLRTINGLYTVYTNLIVFDAERRIVGCSDAARSDLVGATLTDEWVPGTCRCGTRKAMRSPRSCRARSTPIVRPTSMERRFVLPGKPSAASRSCSIPSRSSPRC